MVGMRTGGMDVDIAVMTASRRRRENNHSSDAPVV